MTEPRETAVLLSDYRPPAWLVDDVRLTFRLDPSATRVLSEIRFRPNPATRDRAFRLDGEGLRLIRARIDGAEVTPAVAKDGLTLDEVPDGPFLWQAEVEIDPASNTALEGLYLSKGMFCTQCEAEGFRRITFYPDRPDVMAPFSVRIEGDGDALPVMLSNGNPVASGAGWAEWRDPWPKPSYLFALVAGDLRAVSTGFTTASGRAVDLNVWVRPGDEGRCDYALDSLVRSMRWDEQVYGREYDLDVFNIVAVDDFNMGAMENKGLNVFNSKYVLASPETATDTDYELIEGVVAHEYFHNWTGNRITCRDWFQLCLKEGLTVFRDQEFSADMRSAPVKRISDVLTLRARQFREDNGPLAHPVRPESYVEINNFYTATVYEKGAEIIRMLKTLVGDDGYRTALDLYFDRHDGDAATIEDWIRVFEDATGRDLSQFARWYSQPRTPRLSVTEAWEDGTYRLTFRQTTRPTADHPDPKPLTIPVAVGLLSPNGDEVRPTEVLELTEEEQTFAFDGLGARPIPSILRGFSAPVIVERQGTAEERAFLLANDTDPFNRWEAGRQLAKDVLVRMVTEDASPGPDYLDGLSRVLRDEALDPAFRAFVLALPSEDDMAQTLADAGTVPDPTAIWTARRRLTDRIAAHLSPHLPGVWRAMERPGPYTPDAGAAACRALRQTALRLIARTDGGALARTAFAAADNMTEQLGALSTLLEIGSGEEELAAFHRQWHHDRLVLDKWFALQVAQAWPDDAVGTARRLTEHGAFDPKNPNRFRAVFGPLIGNAAGFHHPSGDGYRLLADWLIRLDPLNPQTAARMTTGFETWQRYDADRQEMAREQLERILAAPDLSRDTREMATRILGA